MPQPISLYRRTFLATVIGALAAPRPLGATVAQPRAIRAGKAWVELSARPQLRIFRTEAWPNFVSPKVISVTYIANHRPTPATLMRLTPRSLHGLTRAGFSGELCGGPTWFARVQYMADQLPAL